MELVPYEPAEEQAAPPLDSIIRSASERYDVPEDRIRAVIGAESNGDPNAVSRAGAQGLMQLMPGTQRDLGVTDPFDPAQNVDAGTRYLSHLHDRFGDWDQAHAGYNMGPERVARGDPLPPETQGYLRKINDRLGDSSDAAPSGLSLHPYDAAADKPPLALQPYDPLKDDGGSGLAHTFAEAAKIPTKVLGEGAAFMGGVAPMVATYLSYAVNRLAGADPDQAHTAAMEARERVDPGEGLGKLAEAVGVDKSWVQSDTFRGFMDEFNEKWIKPASETYFPAQDSLAKTAFEDVANIATFAAAGGGVHAAKGRIVRALPESLQPRTIEDHFAPGQPAEAAPAPEPAPGFVDPNAQARTNLVEGTETPPAAPEAPGATPASPVPPEAPATAPAPADAAAAAEIAQSIQPPPDSAPPIEHLADVATPIAQAPTVEAAIDAAEQAMGNPYVPDIAAEAAVRETPALPEEVPNEQVPAEDAAEPQRVGSENDDGSRQLPQPAQAIGSDRPSAEDAGNYQRAPAQEIGGNDAIQEQGAGALHVRDASDGGEGVRLENTVDRGAPGSRLPEGPDAGDHQLPAREAVAEYRDFIAPKNEPNRGIVKGQVREFASQKLAEAFAKGQGLRGFTAREADGQWRLSRPPLTTAQQANVARLRSTSATVQPQDSLGTMLRKWGRINLAELTRDGVDPKDVASSLRFAYRKTGGLSLDAVAERMAEAGYDVHDEHGAVDSSKARDILQGVIDGNDAYTPEGYEMGAARAAERQQAGFEPTAEELAQADLPVSKDHMENVSMVAEATGRDESHIERLAIQYGDDEAGFLRAVREFNDDQGHETAARGEAGAPAPQATPAEEVDRPTALKRVSEVAERIRSSDPATVVAHVRELDTARAAAVRAGATPHEIIQSMETPRPRLSTQEIADVLKREPLRKPEPPAKPAEIAPHEAPAPAGVSASEPPSIEHVPPALLNRIKVSVEQFHEGEGLKTVEVPAKEALADLDAEISAMKKLLECVGG